MATKAKTAVDNSALIAHAHKSAEAFAQSDLLGSEAQSEIKLALAKATFELWESVRNVWEGVYGENRKCDATASNRAWQRLISACGLVKPKATNKAATKKAAQLVAKQAAQAALKVKSAEGLTDAKKTLAAKALEGDTTAIKEIGMINAELKRREDEAQKAERDHLKSVRDRVKELIGKCEDLEALAKCEALLAAAIQAANAPKVVPTQPKVGTVGEALIAGEKKRSARKTA